MSYDARLRLSSVMMICGPSQCGKTVFVNQLLADVEIFDEKPQRFEWYYGEVEPSMRLPHVKYTKGLPESDNVKEKSVLVLDDLMLESGKDANVTNLFTRIAHHRNCFVIFITQNMYHQSAHNRTRNLNVHYLVLFKNVRDSTIIHTLARQMHPGETQFLVESFKNATKKPYNYLMLTLRPETPEELRVRSDILGENIVYINNQDE